MADEARLLRLQPSRLVLIREVSLCCAGRPLVFARTLIPIDTLRASNGKLGRLGNRPLGSLLFSDPRISRGVMEFARLLPGERLHRKAIEGLDLNSALWARRTLYYQDGQPLLVNEIFLPTLFE